MLLWLARTLIKPRQPLMYARLKDSPSLSDTDLVGRRVSVAKVRSRC